MKIRKNTPIKTKTAALKNANWAILFPDIAENKLKYESNANVKTAAVKNSRANKTEYFRIKNTLSFHLKTMCKNARNTTETQPPQVSDEKDKMQFNIMSNISEL